MTNIEDICDQSSLICAYKKPKQTLKQTDDETVFTSMSIEEVYLGGILSETGRKPISQEGISGNLSTSTLLLFQFIRKTFI